MTRPWRCKLISVSIVSFIVILLAVTGCKNGPDGPTRSIWEILESTENLSIVAGVIDSVGLRESFESDGMYTLFAPSNSAMENVSGWLKFDSFSRFRDDFNNEVMEYHLVNQKILLASLTEGKTIMTLQGEGITVTTGQTLLEGVGQESTISKSDIEATNGVVHIVDVVLFPPTLSQYVLTMEGTPALLLHLGSEVSIFGDGLKQADIFAKGAGKVTITDLLTTNKLAGSKYTVFLPDNTVFDSLSLTVDSFTGEEWYQLISHHIIEGKVSQETFVTGDTFNTLATTTTTKNLTILSSDSLIYIDSNGDDVLDGTIRTLGNSNTLVNGVVHLIDGLLKPN